MRPGLNRPVEGLWSDPSFLKLWGAQTISQVGSQVTLLALPLTAILLLRASALEVALLGAMETLPFLVFALPAGVWVDRLPRRGLMVVADLARAAALVSIPIAYWLDVLALPQLFVVAFVTGIGTVFFDVSYLSYLPSLVGRAQMAGGNARLMATQSGAQIVGPGIGGALIGFAGAPVAILADAVSFCVSGALLGLIRRREAPVEKIVGRRVWTELREGIGYVFRQPYLRILTITTGVSNFFATMLYSLFVLYAARDLEFSPGVIGVIFMLVNVGALGGAVLSGRAVRAIGLGRTIAWAAILGNLTLLSIPLAPQENALPVFIAAALLGPGIGMMFNVNQLSLRQAITPERLLGRMNSVVRFMYWGTMPAGAAAGGVLATIAGVRATLIVGAVGAAVGLFPLAFSSLRHRESCRRQQMPELPEVEAWVRELAPLVSTSPVLRAGPAHIATLKTFDPPLRELEGRRLEGAHRRGKWLLFPTDDHRLQLRIHLMSAGRIRHLAPGAKGPKTPAFRLRFENGGELVLTEAGSKKRAGVWLESPEQTEAELAHIGPEALGLGVEALREVLAGDNRRLHSLLRDQRALAGIGRAHANEILHRARLSPFALSSKLAGDEVERLATAIEEDLQRALELREQGKGDKDVYLVHRHLGEPCPRCGDPLRQVDYEEHTVFYCAPCQTGGRVLKDRRMSRLLR